MLNISIPNELQPFLETQAEAEGHRSLSEYVSHLILLEQARLEEQARVEALLIEGIESGDPIEATDDWWEQKRTQLLNSIPESDA